MRWNVAVAGLPIGVDAWPDGAAVLRQVLGGCPQLPDDVVVEARIEWRRDALDLPTTPPDVRTDDAEYWLDDGGVTAAHSSGLVGHVDGAVLRLGGPAGTREHTRPLRMAVQLPLCQLLGRAGRHVVHAALLRRDGAAVLVAGPSGSGKSTAAYAAARAGWEVLADDMAIVDDGPRGWGFPKPLHVPAEVLGSGAAGHVEIPDDQRRRVVFPAPALELEDGCPIVGVIRVGHADGPASLVPAAPGLAWAQTLLSSFPVAAAPWGARQVFGAAIALARLPAVELRHDADPERRLEAAARLLAAVMDDWAPTAAPDR